MISQLKSSALSACRCFLRPMVRMMLKHGVMHREFVDLSKEIYVEVASKEYGLRGRPTNVSRVSLLTGMDRKEVTRIKNSLKQEPKDPPAQKRDRIARVLAGWHQDVEYIDTKGKPKVLPLDGPAPSYESLTKRYCGDVPAITILKELERVKAVELTGKKKDRARVLRRNYRLVTAAPEAIVRGGDVLANIGATVTHNLYDTDKFESRFERHAANSNIPVSAVPEYRSFIKTEGQQFLEKVDAWLSDHESPLDSVGENQTIRLGLGMYWIQAEQAKGAQQ